MPAFKVIVIDPNRREVRAERLEMSTLKPLYATMACDMVQVVYPDAIGGETLWVDEEGKQKPNRHFQLRTMEHDVLAGVCVITGDDADTGWSPEEIAEFVTWRPDLDGEQLLA
jgi:hypothetical protein